MKRVLRWTLVLLLPATLLSACWLPGRTTYTAFNLTCCTKADLDRLWQPGTTVELHWMVESASVSKLNPTHRVSITAVLGGPYSDQDALKRAIQQTPSGEATHAVQGSVIAMDDRAPPPTRPVTTFLLPTDLPPGYYDLTLIWVDQDGGTLDPLRSVRVGTQ